MALMAVVVARTAKAQIRHRRYPQLLGSVFSLFISRWHLAQRARAAGLSDNAEYRSIPLDVNGLLLSPRRRLAAIPGMIELFYGGGGAAAGASAGGFPTRPGSHLTIRLTAAVTLWRISYRSGRTSVLALRWPTVLDAYPFRGYISPIRRSSYRLHRMRVTGSAGYMTSATLSVAPRGR